MKFIQTNDGAKHKYFSCRAIVIIAKIVKLPRRGVETRRYIPVFGQHTYTYWFARDHL